jgi:hypothetical protein
MEGQLIERVEKKHPHKKCFSYANCRYNWFR